MNKWQQPQLAYCSKVWAPQLSFFSLTSKEFSGAQQNLFYPCFIGPKLVISWGFWKQGFHLCGIGTNFYFSNVPPLDPGALSPLNTIRANTVTFKNSFYCRAPTTLHRPTHRRNVDYPVAHFKKELFNYYFYLTKSAYDVDTPQTHKSVCIKCHTSRPLTCLLDRMCCWFLYQCLPHFWLLCSLWWGYGSKISLFQVNTHTQK